MIGGMMATPADIADLRRLTDEPTPGSEWIDQVLSDYIDLYGMAGAAVRVWGEKAAKYAQLVNISESGSSRSMSQLAENALKMAAFYRNGGLDSPIPGSSDGLTTVHQIQRRTSATQ